MWEASRGMEADPKANIGINGNQPLEALQKQLQVLGLNDEEVEARNFNDEEVEACLLALNDEEVESKRKAAEYEFGASLKEGQGQEEAEEDEDAEGVEGAFEVVDALPGHRLDPAASSAAHAASRDFIKCVRKEWKLLRSGYVYIVPVAVNICC